jgi:hypothetical protein
VPDEFFDTLRLRVSRAGAIHRYLGKQYRLKINLGEKQGVALRGGYLQVHVKECFDELVKQALDAWFGRLAQEQFNRRLTHWSE